MKCILSGVWLRKYLSFNVLFVKVVGMILACGSGMCVSHPLPRVGGFVCSDVS